MLKNSIFLKTAEISESARTQSLVDEFSHGQLPF